MSTTRVDRIPAGWYPDPLSRGDAERRWWDGEKWTEYTAPLAASSADEHVVTAASTDRVTVHGAAATPTARESARIAESMPLHTIVTSSSPTWDELPRVSAATVFSPEVFTPAPENSDFVPVEFQQAYVVPSERPRMADTFASRVHTSAVWLFALMPIMHALVLYYVVVELPDSLPLWTVLLALALPFVLYAAVAAQDARALGNDGHLETAAWGLALFLPPVYLAVRGVQVSRATGAAPWPLLFWVVAQTGVLAAWWYLSPESLMAVTTLFA